MTKTVVFTVKGMKCVHCQASVESAVKAVTGVKAVSVDLAAGTATVSGDFTPTAVTDAIAAAGFRASAQ